MNTLIIDSKEYVVFPIEEYKELSLKAASSITPLRKYSLSQARKLGHKLIDEWTKRDGLT